MIEKNFFTNKQKQTNKRIERSELTHCDKVLQKCTGNIILNDETLNALPLRLEIQQGYPLFSTLLNTLLDITGRRIQKKVRRYIDWK